jgi:hypothetical protein
MSGKGKDGSCGDWLRSSREEAAQTTCKGPFEESWRRRKVQKRFTFRNATDREQTTGTEARSLNGR